jgi:hypothetical protein
MKLTLDLGTTEQPVLAIAIVWHPEERRLEVPGIYLVKFFITINLTFK